MVSTGEGVAISEWGLPAAWYRDPEVFERERAWLGSTWQLVADAAALAHHGDQLALSSLGEPLVIVRDGERLRGFFNVCRHRSGPLVRGCARGERLVCRYHGWTYALDGRLVRAPRMEEEIDRLAERPALRPVEVGQWGPLVFARAASGERFDEWLGAVRAACEPFAIGGMTLALSETYEVAANWKVYVENYLEGYHVPVVHPGLDGEIDFSRYVTEVGTHHVCQYAPLRERSPAAARVYAPTESAPDARYWWLHPNLMLNFYQGILQTNVIVPGGPERTQVRFDWYVPPDFATRHPGALERMRAFSAQVQAEDAAVCEAVQANLASRAHEPGPYSERFERGLALFHRLIRRAIAPDAPRRGRERPSSR